MACKAESERKAEAEDLACSLLAAGVEARDVRARLSEYDVCERTVYNWIREAEKRIGIEAAQHREVYLGRNLSRLEYLWRRAVDDGNLETARKVVADLNKMLGLNEPEAFRFDMPVPWVDLFVEHGIKRPGNGKDADGGGNHAPSEVRH